MGERGEALMRLRGCLCELKEDESLHRQRDSRVNLSTPMSLSWALPIRPPKLSHVAEVGAERGSAQRCRDTYNRAMYS